MNKCVRFELKIGEKLFTFISLYRSPSQTQVEFGKFRNNLELNLDLTVQNNPHLVVAFGDFNAKSKNFYGCDQTNFAGNVLENLFSQFGLHQMINDRTHISDTYSSCIDIIFTSQPYFVAESGVHPSLHPNCQHQIIFETFNLKVHYPPPYYRQVSHYLEADTELIRPAIDLFNGKKFLKILLLMRNLLSLVKLFSMFFTISFLMKHC